MATHCGLQRHQRIADGFRISATRLASTGPVPMTDALCENERVDAPPTAVTTAPKVVVQGYVLREGCAAPVYNVSRVCVCVCVCVCVYVCVYVCACVCESDCLHVCVLGAEGTCLKRAHVCHQIVCST